MLLLFSNDQNPNQRIYCKNSKNISLWRAPVLKHDFELCQTSYQNGNKYPQYFIPKHCCDNWSSESFINNTEFTIALNDVFASGSDEVLNIIEKVFISALHSCS